MDAAGNQVIARPFGSALHQNRRFDLHKSEAIEVCPRCLIRSVPGEKARLHDGAPKVEIAVLQPQLLGSIHIVRDDERGRIGPIENHKGLYAYIHRARGEGGVQGLRRSFLNDARRRDDELRPGGLGLFVGRRRFVRGNHELRLPIAIAYIDEDDAAQVPAPFNPPVERHGGTNVALAELSAGVGAFRECR